MTLKQALRSWYMLFFQIPHLPEWVISANDFAMIERGFKHSSVRKGSFTDTDIAVYKKALREAGALTGGINYYRANFRPLFFPDKKRDEQLSDGRVRVPTLMIYGEQDAYIVPETMRDVNRFVDAPFREVRFKDCGHWIQNEAPAEVNAAIESFLDASVSAL